VCGIPHRRARRYDEYIQQINLFIKLLCQEKGSYYISNDIIEKKDLHRDGLQLDYNGTSKLIHNILSCASTYNPCLGTMWEKLLKWGLTSKYS